MGTLLLNYKDFTLEDFTKTDTKLHNNLPLHLLPNVIRCIQEILIPLDLHFVNNPFNYTITSCYRTIEINSKIGGSPNSDHLKAKALDIKATYDRIQSIFKWATKSGLFRYIKPYTYHIHISLK